MKYTYQHLVHYDQSTGKLIYFDFKTATQNLMRKLPNLLSFFLCNFEEINLHVLRFLMMLAKLLHVM